jgi:uncharacterized protein YgiM (DUF1202 family)
MQTPDPVRLLLTAGRRARIALYVGVAAASALVPALASGQAGRPATGQRAPAPPKPAAVAAGTVRVLAGHTNVHSGPSTGQEVLVLAPKGTILTVTGRDKEWIQVELAPELRKTGMVMRWYKDETRGWVHDSTVESIGPKPPGLYD